MSGRSHDPARIFVRVMGLTEGIEWGFWLVLTVWWIIELGLRPIELILMGTVLEAAVLLGETPTGVVADLFSRKRSIVIAHTLMGLAFIWAVASTNYWVILPAQALYGIAWTFRSGADVAWVTDELKGRGVADDDAIDRLLMRRHRFGISVSVVMVAVAMGAATVTTIRWAGVLFGLLQFAAAAYLSLTMREDHFTPGRENERGFVDTFRGGLAAVRGRPRLRLLVVAVLFVSLGSDAFDRLGWKHFLDAAGVEDDSILVLGALFIALGLSGVAINAIATGALGRGRGVVRVAAVLTLTAAVGGLVIAATDAVWVIALGYLMQDGARESLWPIVEGWGNRDAPSEVRATVHSLVGQVTSVGQLVGGLLLGAIAELASLRWAIAVGAVLFVVAALITRRGRLPRPAAGRSG